MDVTLPGVTLVVKAPNQKIEDQVIECGLEWTIRKLKEHLSMVYPNQPREHNQKLIYSGRLLNDHLVLKDVLRQYDEDQTTHTVHLVCAHDSQMSTITSTPVTKPAAPKPVPASSPPPSTSTTPSTDGLRHRNTATSAAASSAPPPPPTPSVSPTQATPLPQQPAMQQMYPGLDPSMLYGGYYPGQMMMSPEQLAWMQQMYTQQMAQFMQYYQQGGMAVPGVNPYVPQTTAATVTPPPQAEAAPQPAAPVNDEPPPIRMNAQGGPVMDEEDRAHRDWLDYLYTFTRFLVMISIVYFNSSLSRFLLVVGGALLLYLCQMAYTRMRRVREQQAAQRAAAEAPVPAPAPAPAPAPQPAPPPPAAEPPATEGEEQNTEEQQQEGTEATEQTPAQPAPRPPPTMLQLTWSFISTFFSSLIPAPPPVVNAN